MATRYVAASGGSTSGSAATPATAWTLAHANTNLSAGDIAHLLPGTYTTTIAPSNSGTSGNPIVYRGDSVGGVTIATTADDMVRIEGRSYITLETMTLFSVGHTWIRGDADSDGIHLKQMVFDSDDPPSGPWAEGNDSMGIRLWGDDCIIESCTLLRWLGVDGCQMRGDHAWVKDSTFGNSGHGTLHMSGNAYVVQRCYFRNKWARGANFSTHSGDAGDQLNGLVEDCIFFDCNYIDSANEGDPAAGWIANVDSDGPGDEQVVGKMGGTGLIFRNNLVVRSHTTQNASNTYRADCQIGNYNDSPYWRRIRAYHNTHVDGEVHPWSITYRSAGDMDARDSRFLNNVWYPIAQDGLGIDNVGFWFNVATADDGSGSYTFMDTWHFHNNVNPRGWRYSGSTRTVSQFEALFSSAASGNLSGTPTFVNDDVSEAVADRDLPITRDNFLLTGTVGKEAAASLTTVTATSSGTTLSVADAYVFSDGNGLVEGDVLLIDGQETSVVSVDSATQLTVSPAISVSEDDAVWLARYGASPDIGMLTLDEEVEEPAVTLTPELLDVVASSTAEVEMTSGTVSVDAGDLLVVLIAANNQVSGELGTPMSISDSFGETLDWDDRQANRSSGSGVCVGVFVAVASQAGSGSVTIAFANACNSKALRVLRVPAGSFDAANPIAQWKTHTGSNSSPFTLTLDSTPAADSLVLALVGTRGSGPFTILPGDGYTELNEEQPTGSHGSQVQYRSGGADSAVSWSGVFGGSGLASAAIEIAAAEEVVVGEAEAPGVFAPLPSLSLGLSL